MLANICMAPYGVTRQQLGMRKNIVSETHIIQALFYLKRMWYSTISL